jgi:MarR family transcriptional regulator, transcriptional regulator for hemolysin
MMEVEKATAGRLIDRLEAKGWVKRRVDNADRRINRVYLTPEAQRIHKRIWKIAQATVNDSLTDLSRTEAAQLSRLLGCVKSTLLSNLEGPPAASRQATSPPPARRAARRVNGHAASPAAAMRNRARVDEEVPKP